MATATKRKPTTRRPRPRPAQRITNLDLYAKIVEVKEDVADGKLEIVKLREHVNHRSGIIEKRLNAIDTLIGLKAEKTDLLTSVGFRLLAKPFIRWALGVAGATMLATLGREHWFPYVEDVLRAVGLL